MCGDNFLWELQSQSQNLFFYSICSWWIHKLIFCFEHCLQMTKKKPSSCLLWNKHWEFIPLPPTSYWNKKYYSNTHFLGWNKVWIMRMNVFWVSVLQQFLLLCHISNLMIGSHTVHNIDVISKSRMSQYGSHVACMIISNPLCSSSGLATDPCWPPWNWFLRLNPKQAQIKPRYQRNTREREREEQRRKQKRRERTELRFGSTERSVVAMGKIDGYNDLLW